MSLTSAQASNAILGDFQSRWPTLVVGWTHATQTEFPNDPTFSAPDADVEWLSIQIEIAGSEGIEIGRKLWRRPGFVTLQVYLVLKKGAGRVFTLRDAVLDWAETFQAAGVNMLDQPLSLNTVGADGSGWYRFNAVVPFTADLLRS